MNSMIEKKRNPREFIEDFFVLMNIHENQNNRDIHQYVLMLGLIVLYPILMELLKDSKINKISIIKKEKLIIIFYFRKSINIIKIR